MDELHFTWTVFSRCSLVCPHVTSPLGVNLELTTVSKQWATTDRFWAWAGDLITIFMLQCHLLLLHLFFVDLFWPGFFSLFPSLAHLSLTFDFLWVGQMWKQQTRVLNGKGLFCRHLQTPNEIKKANYKHLIQCSKSFSVCEEGRKPRAVQFNPGSE